MAALITSTSAHLPQPAAAAGSASPAAPLTFARRPDDLHYHFRDGVSLQHTVPAVSRLFARAIAMPNLKPPVTDAAMALAYHDRLLAHVPAEHMPFTPLMTLYLTDNTTPEMIVEAHATGKVVACKLYPAGATTNSDSGVTDFDTIVPTLQKMAEVGMLLLVHGEVTHAHTDVFDKEAAFIEEKMKPLVKLVPSLRIVMEHVTTREAVEFVTAGGPNLAATITPQHLMYNRNAIFHKGIRPHMYCLPILKRETHRRALVGAVKSGSPKFFLGTDSAPHAKGRKESACGCAGCYSAHGALEMYAEIFAAEGVLHLLEAFASQHGADFYGMPRNPAEQGGIRLEPTEWEVPAEMAFGEDIVVPLKAGEVMKWTATRVAAE
jgi:dihydroorotase